jgi:hypothetical protein
MLNVIRFKRYSVYSIRQPPYVNLIQEDPASTFSSFSVFLEILVFKSVSVGNTFIYFRNFLAYANMQALFFNVRDRLKNSFKKIFILQNSIVRQSQIMSNTSKKNKQIRNWHDETMRGGKTIDYTQKVKKGCKERSSRIL